MEPIGFKDDLEQEPLHLGGFEPDYFARALSGRNDRQMKDGCAMT
jgi:hypothetical protein